MDQCLDTVKSGDELRLDALYRVAILAGRHGAAQMRTPSPFGPIERPPARRANRRPEPWEEELKDSKSSSASRFNRTAPVHRGRNACWVSLNLGSLEGGASPRSRQHIRRSFLH